MKRIDLPEGAALIINRLKSHGYEAYIVGGCVRDALMGREPNDWDVCTSALPAQIMAVFSHYPVIETGVQHGTVTVLVRGTGYEITTYRVDGAYSDGRHPDKVSFVSSLAEDLSRRDFTINAMAYAPDEGLVDLFGGQEDIQNRVIRCVGTPSHRFCEDYLRILRTMRFASTLGFAIEQETMQAMLAHFQGLKQVSMERICTEFRKMVVGETFPEIVDRCRDIIGFLIPEFVPCFALGLTGDRQADDVWSHILQTMTYYHTFQFRDELVALALFFHDIGKPKVCTEDEQGHRSFKGHAGAGADMTNEILRRMKFDNASRERIVELVRYHTNRGEATAPAARRLLNKLGEAQVRRLFAVQRCDLAAHVPEQRAKKALQLSRMEALVDEIIKRDQCYELKKLAVKGKDLIEAGFRPGRQMGEILQSLLEAVMDERVPNEKETLLALARDLCKE